VHLIIPQAYLHVEASRHDELVHVFVEEAIYDRDGALVPSDPLLNPSLRQNVNLPVIRSNYKISRLQPKPTNDIFRAIVCTERNSAGNIVRPDLNVLFSISYKAKGLDELVDRQAID
jgi:hypothetical protein